MDYGQWANKVEFRAGLLYRTNPKPLGLHIGVTLSYKYKSGTKATGHLPRDVKRDQAWRTGCITAQVTPLLFRFALKVYLMSR